MTGPAISDSRLLLLLCSVLPARGKAAPQPLSAAEWARIRARLAQAGLSRPGELLDAGPDLWAATGLAEGDLARLQGLVDRADTLDSELERLAGRGIRAITIADPGYPARLCERLGEQSPPVLFGAGDWSLLKRPGLAVVGSRDVDEAGARFTQALARRCARDRLGVITGGARGVDQIAMQAALEAGGTAVGVPAGDLERVTREQEAARWIDAGSLLLLSPFHPTVGFTVAHAMARNKVVYALAEYGLVVSSAHGQGGTWAGAREVLRHGWVPLFVRDDPSVPDGNRELLRPSARPFPPLDALDDEPLGSWLARQIVLPSGDRHGEREAATTEDGQDLFPLIWPHLAEFLKTPHYLNELAAAFGLVPAQARAWLRRAEAEGRVTGKGRPCRYRLLAEPPARQFRLFEAPTEYEEQPAPVVATAGNPTTAPASVDVEPRGQE